LNLPFFSVRAVIYLGIWFVLFFLNKWSLEQDRTGDRRLAKNMRLLSGPGMVLLIFSVTFAAIDWFMSLERNGHRRSTVLSLSLLRGA
jgi:hypothetical protein